MANTGHVTCRIYGQAFGTPPFQNDAGTQSQFSNFKAFPVAPLANINTDNANLWPLVTGFWTGAFYVYSVIEQAPTGLNQPTIKLATDTSVSTLASSGT